MLKALYIESKHIPNTGGRLLRLNKLTNSFFNIYIKSHNENI